MSGFYADNSRIRVIETVNNVDETVFDTDNDMPHIIGTAYIANQVVDFDNLTQTETFVENVCVPTYTNELVLVYVPTYWYYELVYVWPNYFFGDPGGYTYQRVTEYAYYTYEWQWVYDPCGYYTPSYVYNVDAEEYASTTNLVALPTDEDGNSVDVDFIIVQATGSRTTGGKDPRFDQALPTTVPTKTFSFQGSVLLESSGRANGDSWFRRIMSVYSSGSQLKLKVQESIAALTRDVNDSAFPHINETRSTYSFNFKVFFGRFKS